MSDTPSEDKEKMGTFMRGMAAGLVLAHFNRHLILGKRRQEHVHTHKERDGGWVVRIIRPSAWL